MLRLRNGQMDLWEVLLPPGLRLLSAELQAIDALLDDEVFLAPFTARLACPIGRPTIPMETGWFTICISAPKTRRSGCSCAPARTIIP